MAQSTGDISLGGLKKIEPILASIREAVLITSADGGIVLANPATEFILGSPPHAILGKRIQDTMNIGCQDSEDSFFKEALEGWKAVELPQNCSLLRASGGTLPLAATATPLYGPSGAYAGVVFVFRDLTEEKKLKQRQYEFLSFVSHQLRRPMGSFRWGIELLLANEKTLAPPHREILDDLLKIATKFGEFVRDLVDIARFEEGRFDFDLKPVDLRDPVRKAEEEIRPLATSHNITIRLFTQKSSSEPAIVVGDRMRLRDVFLNLLTNSVRYNRPRGEVRVESEILAEGELLGRAQSVFKAGGLPESLRLLVKNGDPSKRYILLTVADTGMGIPKDEQPSVFQSFFRGSNVAEKGLEGTGLGLFIVRSIVEHLGGSIFFESKENEGTTFYLIFPYEG